MVTTDENALVCDFAETYHVIDWRALPVRLAAILAAGLRDDSRIKVKLSGQRYPFGTLLLAAAVDRLSTLVYFQTKDAQKGTNKPHLILDSLQGVKEDDAVVFDSIEDFETARRRLIGGY